MSGSTSHSSPWRRLLGKRQADFQQACTVHGLAQDLSVRDEATFRIWFETLCKDKKERNYTRLLVKLRFGPIISFATKIDELEGFFAQSSVAALISSGTATVIEACTDSVGLAGIVRLLGGLNSTVPQLAADIPRLPSDESLHTPLHRIFEIYVGCLLIIISHAAPAQYVSYDDRIATIEDAVRQAAHKFREEGEAFNHMMEKAARLGFETRGYASSSSSETRYSVNDSGPRFTTQKLLGRGSEGDVYQVKEVSTGAIYARKTIQTAEYLNQACRKEEQVRNEVEIMKRLTHDHIVSIAFWQKGPGVCFIYMTPSADTNLGGYLLNCIRDGFSEDILRLMIPWFGCLLDALAFAHRRKIAHRDIKPSNILIRGRQVFLADFGEAKDFSQQAAARTSNYLICGTPVYRAPEVTPGHPRGLPADVFSLGCVYSEMLTICAHRTLEEYQAFRQMPTDEYPYAFRSNLTAVHKWLKGLDGSEQLLDPLNYLIKRMLRTDPEERQTAQELCKWLYRENASFYCEYH